MSDTATRTLLTREERRASLLEAAATAFARSGYDGTSMEDVANEAGVTRLILYRNFDGKAALYQAVLEQVSERLRDEFLAGLDAKGPGAERDGSLPVVSAMTVARAHPDALRLLWVHAVNEPEFASYAAQYREIAVAVAQIGVPARLGGARRRWAGEWLVSFLITSVLTWLDHGDESHDEWFMEQTAANLAAMVERF